MKHLLITTIAALVLVGCGESQQSAPPVEVESAEPVAEAAQPKPPTAKAPDISIHEAAMDGDIEAVKQHLAAGTDVNAKDEDGYTLLTVAVAYGSKEIVELLIFNGVDVNASDPQVREKSIETHEVADILRKHGGKTGAELKAEAK